VHGFQKTERENPQRGCKMSILQGTKFDSPQVDVIGRENIVILSGGCNQAPRDSFCLGEP